MGVGVRAKVEAGQGEVGVLKVARDAFAVELPLDLPVRIHDMSLAVLPDHDQRLVHDLVPQWTRMAKIMVLLGHHDIIQVSPFSYSSFYQLLA